jgi:ABC-2 type transport system ATP-binding protein
MILLDAVTKEFNQVRVVDHVSFEVGKGEYFALLGPNGAGKTTLIKMLMGFIQPTSGSIFINGIPSHETRTRKNIGYIAEQNMIPPYLSGFEYLFRHAALMGLSKKDACIEIKKALEIVSMSGKEKAKSSEYSKGMRQRIGLAAAIMGQPDLLVLDEPVSGLDPIRIRDVRHILDHLRDRGLTVILNSHLLSEVEKTCDTAAIMHNGKIVVKGSIDTIAAHGETLEDIFIKHVTKP